MEYLRLNPDSRNACTLPGNPQVVTDLLGGQVQAGFVATPGVLTHVKDGRLVALLYQCATHAGRCAVPTVAESGYPDFDIGFYLVMLAPAGTPEPIRSLLERECATRCNRQTFRRGCGAGIGAIASTGAEAKSRLKVIANDGVVSLKPPTSKPTDRRCQPHRS